MSDEQYSEKEIDAIVYGTWHLTDLDFAMMIDREATDRRLARDKRPRKPSDVREQSERIVLADARIKLWTELKNQMKDGGHQFLGELGQEAVAKMLGREDLA